MGALKVKKKNKQNHAALDIIDLMISLLGDR